MLDVSVRPLSGCPDLLPVVQGLPARTPVIWLDSARLHPVTGRWSLLGYDPWLTLTAQGDRIELRTSASTRVWREPPLEALRTVLRRYRVATRHEPHMNVLGLMGFLSYELNGWIEPRLRLGPVEPSDRSIPEMAWFGMRMVILVDHAERRSWLLSVVDPHRPPRLARWEAADALEEAEDRLRATSGPGAGGWSAPSLEATSTPAEFTAMVSRALDEIRAGEIFQANVSQRFTGAWRGSPLALYQALRRANPSPFACFLSCGALSVVSCSPERLVRIQDGWAQTRPIAGTRPRGASLEDDALNSLELLLSDKERAEHVMLVDLARNDLGRVCVKGSVRVNELMSLEAYSHVMHIVSDVGGRLRGDVDAVDVIRAVFPGGTITGCPKVRCMEILRQMEPVPRGLYTGSVGWLGFHGAMDLNIAIRTVVIQGDRLSFHVGAGIVADSDPEREYQETLAKAGALVEALTPVEPHPAARRGGTITRPTACPPRLSPASGRGGDIPPTRTSRHHLRGPPRVRLAKPNVQGPDGGVGRTGPCTHAASR